MAEYGLDLGTPCFKPAETNLDVASGFEASARWTADAAAPPAVVPLEPEDPALAKISGRDVKYLCGSQEAFSYDQAIVTGQDDPNAVVIRQGD